MTATDLHTPPHSPESERSLVAACMLYRDSIEAAVDAGLRPEHLYDRQCREVFGVCSTLLARGDAPDLPTVVAHLRDADRLDAIGGPDGVAALIDYPAAINSASACRTILRDASNRALLDACYRVIRDIRTSPDAALDDALGRLTAIDADRAAAGSEAVSAETLVHDLADRLERFDDETPAVTGIATGYGALDALTAGFHSGDLIILAARPSMGKTALAVGMTGNMARDGRKVLFFSLEMGRAQIIDRVTSAESEVNLMKFRAGGLTQLDRSAILTASNRIQGWPLFVDDSAALHYQEIGRRARRIQREHGIEVIFVDYLQHVRGDSKQGRNYEIESITRSLKATAKDLSVPVVLLSQLNRAVESRQDKTPQLSDLRDSGAVEQDADLVLFLHRPGRYQGPDADQSATELSIAKHRNGPIGAVKLFFDKSTAHFEDA